MLDSPINLKDNRHSMNGDRMLSLTQMSQMFFNQAALQKREWDSKGHELLEHCI